MQAGFVQDKAGFDALVHDVRQDKQLLNSKTKCDRNVHHEHAHGHCNYCLY